MKSLVAQPKKQRENNRTLEYLHFWASPQARKSSSVALKLTLIELWLLYFQSLIKKKRIRVKRREVLSEIRTDVRSWINKVWGVKLRTILHDHTVLHQSIWLRQSLGCYRYD